LVDIMALGFAKGRLGARQCAVVLPEKLHQNPSRPPRGSQEAS